MRWFHYTRRAIVCGYFDMSPITGLSGCTHVRQLEPTFKVNQTNLTGASANAHSMADAVERLAKVVYDAEVRHRRVQVWSQLRTIWSDTRDRMDGNQITPLEWATGKTGRAVRLQQLRAALPATNDTNRARLAISDPVLYALVTLEVSEAEVWRGSAIAGDSGTNAADLPNAISDKYPAVRDIILERDRVMAQLTAYKETLHRQTTLAQAHAAAFVEVARTNADIANIFGSLIADDELRGQALGLIRGEQARSTADEALTILRDFLTTKDK